jgi:hypothetical protein
MTSLPKLKSKGVVEMYLGVSWATWRWSIGEPGKLETACQPVLSYGSELIVVEPAALRKLTCETMTATLNLYN